MRARSYLMWPRFGPAPVDMSEFRTAGGGPKCRTLELRP